jgi:hypothetical protein
MPIQPSSNQVQIHPHYARLSNSLSAPVGYSAPAKTQSDRPNHESSELANFADEVLRDPLLMVQLTERVYELLLNDLHYQQERSHNYGGYLK